MGLEIDRAEGPFIYTIDGKRFTDLISGIAVSSLGHRHPNVLKAIKDQLEKHLHVMVYGEFIQSPQSRFAKLLCDQLPEMLDRVYFVNSGTESVEGALKLAKKFTGRSKFVAFQNSYHGDTHGSLSVTGRNVYRDPYQPLLPNVYFSDFNSDEVFDLIDDETAALIMEPIQGEGGIIPAEKKWLQKVRRRCNEVGALLVFDEIQTGFYRTGSLFAFQYYDVVPDIMCLAKAMAGGMPMGAFVSSSEIFEVFKKDPPLNHVTTFGGHPVSCAAAHASLKTLLSEDFEEKAMKIEKIVRSVLKGDGIVEVRGRGAMLGLQLQDSDLTQKVVKHCFEHGIILGWTLHSNSLIRIAPPLIIDQELLVDSLQIIIEAIQEYL
ncbi:MAG: aminotransferase class III-fold pyridoxal phosphate-dependent enzyme [Bacteroidetes bacterium]|jgi:acetylornithine/succinyldiaminopimelate/putrescine aminotransferase|nr:aminotransferase class III-fold pyridoxal phosphate-dependent enzyme [Bacteroidota bacterium]